MSVGELEIERESEAVESRVRALVSLATEAGLGKTEKSVLYRVASALGETYDSLLNLDAHLALARWQGRINDDLYDTVHRTLMGAVRLFGNTGPFFLLVFKGVQLWQSARNRAPLPLDIASMESAVAHCRSWAGISPDFLSTAEFSDLIRDSEKEMIDGSLFALPCNPADDAAGAQGPVIPETREA